MEKISSTKNAKVKEWVKLKTNSGRKKFKKFLLEGRHPVETALEQSTEYEYLIVQEEFDLGSLAEQVDQDKLILVTKEIANHIADTVHDQGIFLIGYIDESAWEVPADPAGQWLVLDNVQDPGNIGTMVRTADAAGFTGVIFGDGTADFYNPKILRSMQGSQYHLQMKRLNLEKWVKLSKANGSAIYGSILDENAQDYRKIDAPKNFSLIMGNEGNGMNPALIELTDTNLYIPIKGSAESLNVAIAAGVLMFGLVD
jgi:TrmH family RNA methyltransferase